MPHRVNTLLSLAVITLSCSATAAHARPARSYERQAVSAVNDVRAQHGLRTLRRVDCLKSFADLHARRMAQRRALVHQDLSAVVRRCRLSRGAENVAVGYGTGLATVEAGWMQSPEHRANILTRGHRLTAVGAFRDGVGLWWTVQLLGRR